MPPLTLLGGTMSYVKEVMDQERSRLAHFLESAEREVASWQEAIDEKRVRIRILQNKIADLDAAVERLELG